jgi:phosphohistidine phosphatase
MSQPFELILLRHAHAEPSGSVQHDRERALSERGIEEARDAGQWLAGQPLPTRVICSSAQRARQTAEQVMQQFDGGALTEEARIYEAEPRDLLDVIDSHREAGRLLLVGHNPGLESLVALLTTGQSGDHRGMPPGGIARLEFDADAPLEPGSARLTAFWSP